MRNKGLYFIILAVAVCIVLIALGGGIFHQEAPYILQWQHRMFAGFCHQDPARSLWFNGQPMAVCSRCLGIYSLFAAGWFLLPALGTLTGNTGKGKTVKMLIAAAVAVNLLDIIGNYLGIWQNTLYSRLAFGALLGLSAVVLFVNDFKSLKSEQTGDVDGTIRTTAHSKSGRT